MSEVVSPEVSVVVLTRGDRPEALDAAVASATAQRGVNVEVLVVWNGCGPADLDRAGGHELRSRAVSDIALAENLGIPEGRNVGARHTGGAYLFFLDDDAEIVGANTFTQLVRRFEQEPDLGVIGARIVDEHGDTAQRHVPRWGRASAGMSGEVTSFLGGVVAIRRSAFESVGGYAGEFFYAMEETDLGWRLADAGWRIWYDAGLHVRHPKTNPGRHSDAATRTARNRVWLVHRTLPAPIAVVYLANWLIVTGLRAPAEIRPTLTGYRTGWRSRLGPRRPIRWSTVARLTRLGRPPVL